MIINLPIPSNFFEWTWLAIGLLFARAFGKRIDFEIQQTEWFKRLDPIGQWLICRICDFLHHWWVGTLLMLYFTRPEIYWFGYGLFLDDLPDIPSRLSEMLNYLFKEETSK